MLQRFTSSPTNSFYPRVMPVTSLLAFLPTVAPHCKHLLKAVLQHAVLCLHRLKWLPVVVRVTSSRCNNSAHVLRLSCRDHWKSSEWFIQMQQTLWSQKNKTHLWKTSWTADLDHRFYVMWKNKHSNVAWMRMDHWGFCGLSPPIITPQAGIRDGLIALQALLENGGSFLESQAIRSTFSTQRTPVPSTLLSEWSRNKERDICWMSVQLSASVVPQPDALWTGRTIHPSQSTDLQVGRSYVVNLPPCDCTRELWPLSHEDHIGILVVDRTVPKNTCGYNKPSLILSLG